MNHQGTKNTKEGLGRSAFELLFVLVLLVP